MKLFICIITFLFAINQVCSKQNRKNIIYVASLITQRKSISNRGFESFIEDMIENNIFDKCEHRCNDNCEFLLILKNFTFELD